MQIVKYYTTQTDLATALKFIVDEYLENNMTDDEMSTYINDLIDSNPDIFYKNDKVPTRIKAILGKKRLSLINNVLRQVRGWA